jgi:GNAT superfamily N-acetyltransferase
MGDLELREIAVTERELMERIGELRVRAWATELHEAIEGASWLDDFDSTSRHWAVLQGGQPVGAARLSIHSCLQDLPYAEDFVDMFTAPPPAPIASLNRLVVDPAFRGNGLGYKLDLVRLEAAEASGCRCIVGSTCSGERRVRQLVKLGFMIVGTAKPVEYQPWRSMPSPVVLICNLPRQNGIEKDDEKR